MSARPPSLLVVDDDKIVRRLVVRELERLGCGAIHEATNGVEAQRLLEKLDFDVVITDVMMPELDGLKLMRWAQEACPDPSWIILSGVDTFDAAVEAIQLGAFDFLAKPPQVDQLRVAVRNALERRALVRELAESNRHLTLKVGELKEACRILEDQAAVIRRDLERAEVIQRALLPKVPPPLEGFSLATLYRSGRHVGGDLYDVVALDGRHVVLVIADASGHGVSAAMLSVLFKLHLEMRDAGTGAPVSPATALTRVNSALALSVTAPGMFITAAYCLLDLRAGKVLVASAGHPPLLHRKANGVVESIERTGPALGIDAKANFSETQVRLERGDRLLLFTDGMLGSDARPNRVRERLEAGSDLQTTLETLRADAERSIAAEDRDDVTAILLEARAGACRFDDGVARTEPAPAAAATSSSAAPAQCEIIVGKGPTGVWVRIVGRANWTAAEPFHHFALGAVWRGSALTLDLSDCEHLDSTFLGTIHDVVQVGRDADLDVRLQGLSPELRSLFEELCMKRVLACISEQCDPPPNGLEPLTHSAPTDALAMQRVLHAHESLASLSDQNREQFRLVIENLRAELDDRTRRA